jgi:hypothetical protein
LSVPASASAAAHGCGGDHGHAVPLDRLAEDPARAEHLAHADEHFVDVWHGS